MQLNYPERKVKDTQNDQQKAARWIDHTAQWLLMLTKGVKDNMLIELVAWFNKFIQNLFD